MKKSPDLVKLELARLRAQQKKNIESNYIDTQRSKLPLFAFIIAILALSFGSLYKIQPEMSPETVRVVESKSTDVYQIIFHSGLHLTFKYEGILPIKIGDELNVYWALTKDVHHAEFGDQQLVPILSFYHYSGFAILTGLLLIYAGLAARFNWKWWFQFWMFGLISAFSTALCFFVTR